MNNRFIIITTCYNVTPWIEMNIYMNKFQTYKDVLYVYIDDNSTDSTYDIINKLVCNDSRFLLLKNDNNGSQGKSYMYAIDYLEKNQLICDQDIIVEVDGDDWVSSCFVLEYLNQIYQNKNIWMTYGQYQIYPTGNIGGHFSMEILDQVDQYNLYRQNAFPYSHLKTYKYWLFNKIDRNDLINNTTNEIYSAAWDHALCIPMVEMAGKKHIHRCDDILYILNRSQELQNEGKTRGTEQKSIEQQIRSSRIYNRLNCITFNLKGPGAPGGVLNYGLGNLLFQIATGVSLAKDNNSVATFPQLVETSYGGYHKNIFKQINTFQPSNITNNFKQPSFNYSDIPFIENCIYDGYFQSEKFFKHNREYILSVINDIDTIQQIKEVYPNISSNSVSLHIRRGDYVNLQNHHPLQSIEYYNLALDKINNYDSIYVFSDDMDWCKQTLKYENMIFVENQTDVFDLFAMALCSNNIIANSTFSWWGAWLNTNPTKKVVAPSTWFGQQRVELQNNDIVPENWILI